MSDFKPIGIIIVNYNNWNETVECVNSILDCNYHNVRIIIVDNASPNNSYEHLKKHFDNNEKYKNVFCILSEKNGGYAYGNNVGLEFCVKRGIENAIITNGDVYFDKDAITQLISTILKNEKCVIAAPHIEDINGNEVSIPWLKHQNFLQFIGLQSTKNMFIPPKNRNRSQRVFMVSGCCYALNIHKFKKMGALDEGTFLYVEEGTMAMQAQNAGYEIWYTPKAKIIHNHKFTNSLFADFTLLKSCLYYWKKYEKGTIYHLIAIKNIFLLKIIIKLSMNKYSDKKNFKRSYNDFKGYYRMIKESN